MTTTVIATVTLTLIAIAALALDLKIAYGYYRPRRGRKTKNLSFWKWWRQTYPLKLAVGTGLYLLGLVFICVPQLTLTIPTSLFASESIWTLLLTLSVAGFLLLNLKRAYRLYRRKRRQTSPVATPFPLWWARTSRARLILAGGVYLFGLLLIYSPDFSWLLPAVNTSDATIGILWALFLSLLYGGFVVGILRKGRRNYRSLRKQGTIGTPFPRWWFEQNRFALLTGGGLYLIGLLMGVLPIGMISLPVIDALSAAPGALAFLLLTLALTAVLVRDLKRARKFYRIGRRSGKITEPFWRWWLQKNPLKLAVGAGLYLLGLVFICAPQLTLTIPTSNIAPESIWTPLLTLSVAVFLLLNLKRAYRLYRRKRRQKIPVAPFPLWWARHSRARLILAGGVYLFGLLLIYSPDFSWLLPAVSISDAMIGILWALFLTLLFGGYIVRDLLKGRRVYRSQRKQGMIEMPFLRWWFEQNRFALMVGGGSYLIGLLMVILPIGMISLPVINYLSATPGAPAFLLISLAVTAVLVFDLKLARTFYRTRRKTGKITDPFWRWWLLNNPLKLVVLGGVFLFGLSIPLFPEFTLDLPVFNLILNPQFLLYLVCSDPRTLVGLIVTVVLVLYLLVDLGRARNIYRDFVKSRGKRGGFVRWWAAKNRLRLAVAGGGYLGGLLVAFLLIPWAIGYFGSGPTRYLNRATTYFQQKKYQEAVGELRKALGREPGNAGIHLALAQTLMQLGLFKESLEESRAATRLDPKLYQAHLLQATLALAANDTAQALDAARSARDIQPKLTEPRALLARIHTQRQEHDQAMVMLRELVIQEPDNKEYRTQLISNALIRRDYAEANKEADAGLRQAASMELHALRASALQGLGKTDEALTALKSAVTLDPKSARPYLLMGNLLIQKGEYRAAIAKFEEALVREPANIMVMNNLACLLAEHDFDLERAAQLATQAYQRQPGEPANIDTLGWILYRQGKHEAAVSLLRKAVTLAPAQPELRYHLGAALLEAGQQDAGRAELAQALKLSPNFPGAAHARTLLGTRAQKNSHG